LGQSIDPDFEHFPVPLGGEEPYARLRNGRVVSSYLSPFVWLTLPFAAALGFFGQGVLPAIAGGVTVWLTGRLGGRWAAGIVALATPLLFYSSVFWEHSLVTALATAAFVVLEPAGRERPLTAGLLLGAAALLREELLLLLGAVSLALLVAGRGRRSFARFAAGGACGVLALLAFHRLVSGAWLGVHVGVNAPDPFGNVPAAIDGLLLSGGFSGVGSTWIVAAVATLIASRSLPGRAAEVVTTIVALGFAFVSVAAFQAFPGGQDRALALISSNSALVFVPWVLVVPFLRDAGDKMIPIRRPGVLAASAALFLAAFVLVVPERSITGIHPGPRMLLPVLPLFAALAAARWRAGFRFALVPLLVVAVAWNVRSLELLHGKRHATGALAAALREDPRRIVATELFWLPTELSSLAGEKQFHLVSGSASFAKLAERAEEAGEDAILVVVPPGLLQRHPDREVRSPGFPAFSADLYVQPLAPE
jgi:hypothetical protein